MMIKYAGQHFSRQLLVIIIIISTTSCIAKQTIKFTINSNALGSYSFEYETADGTYRREDGGMVSDPQSATLVVRGEYGYIDTEGRPFSLKYIADSKGYRPQVTNDVRFNNRRII